jgi:tetratricopeptide (TPR) repeat protein
MEIIESNSESKSITFLINKSSKYHELLLIKLNYARILFLLKDYENSLKEYEKCNEMKKNDNNILKGISLNLFFLKRYDESIDILLNSEKNNELYDFIAKIYYKRNNFKDSKIYFEKSINYYEYEKTYINEFNKNEEQKNYLNIYFSYILLFSLTTKNDKIFSNLMKKIYEKFNYEKKIFIFESNIHLFEKNYLLSRRVILKG